MKRSHSTLASPTGQRIPAFSEAYRPDDYFGRYDLQTELMTRVRGHERRRMLRQALDAGEIDAVPEAIRAPELSSELRAAVGRIHPDCMGGEYLARAKAEELEIARIRIRSTTSDVVGVYARPVGKRIAYRVVDEYEGDTLSEPRSRTSMRPLTMGQLVDFFLGAWDLYCCLDANFEDDLAGMLRFFSAESEFYPCLEDELERRVRLHFAHLEQGNSDTPSTAFGQ